MGSLDRERVRSKRAGQNVTLKNGKMSRVDSNASASVNCISNLVTCIIFLLASMLHCDGANVLSVSFFSSRSHSIVFEPLLVQLVERGHHLTIISPEDYTVFSSNKTYANSVSQITGKQMEDYSKINFIQSRMDQNYLSEPLFFATILEPLCRSYLEMPQVQGLLTGKKKFDLIITSAMMNECTLGYVSQFKTPFILTIPFSPLAITAGIFGAPSPNSFVPTPVFGSNTHQMNFLQRVQNMVTSTFISLSFRWYTYPMVEKVYRSILGDHVPSVIEIQQNASLILTNSHFTLNYQRPGMPDVVEVGGMHCRPGGRLSSDLEEFLNESGLDGFIYLSFGSVIKSTDMPDEQRRVFVNVFSRLRQRILWKWENGTMEGAPDNVRMSKWVPQQDILAHPKIKLFITHGGLLSTQEAVYHGVPLVGLPIFADQDWNMAQAEASGYALTLDFRTLTEKILAIAINRVLTESSFTNKVKALSSVFKDRPEHPLTSAVYWTEYVIRHNGAPHLRSAARDLNFVEYYSIDVLTFLSLIILYLMYVLYRISAFVILAVSVITRAIFRSFFDLRSKIKKIN